MFLLSDRTYQDFILNLSKVNEEIKTKSLKLTQNNILIIRAWCIREIELASMNDDEIEELPYENPSFLIDHLINDLRILTTSDIYFPRLRNTKKILTILFTINLS
jgi:hypothetical protein